MITATKPQTKQLTPFLKYAGGKTWLAPRLAGMYEPFRKTHTWVEPFCGALGATLGVMPERAILSDVNPHLINLYRHIQEDLQSPSGWENSKGMFDHVRETFNRSLDPNSTIKASEWWRAKAFYYLNRTCFNGLCRFNLSGEFNVGYGKFKKPILDHDFSLYQEAFKEWDFYNRNFNDFLIIATAPARPSFIYADPPYDAGFTGYSGSFTWDDQVNLASTLAALNCPVVASNKATDRIIDLYTGFDFHIEIVSARRRISCNGDRTNVDEILATKNI
jgi:DNA adenine methylase